METRISVQDACSSNGMEIDMSETLPILKAPYPLGH